MAKEIINTAKYLVGTTTAATPGIASTSFINPPGFPQPNQKDAYTLGTFTGAITNKHALQKFQIDMLINIYKVFINLSTPNQLERDLRERIIKIALSYVGQKTYYLNYSDKFGFIDPLMEKKYRNIGWENDQEPNLHAKGNSGRHYCNYTVNLIWCEALGNGNSFVKSTLNYPSNLTFSTRYGSAFNPTKLPSNFQYAQGNNKKSYGLMTPGTVNTAKNFNNLKKFINIDKDPTLFEKAYKNGKGKIRPGDAVMFDWHGENGINSIDHIGIFLSAAKVGNTWKITTIEGNVNSPPKYKLPTTGERLKKNGIWMKTDRKISQIIGFCQLFTNADL